MALKRIKNPTPQGVGAGQTASVALSRGYTHERLIIRLNVDGVPRDVPEAEWIDYIDDIRLKVNGKVEMVMTADYLVKILAYGGKPFVDGALPIFLADPDDDSPADRMLGAYGTLGIQSFTLEIDLKAAKTFNSLDVYSLVSPNTPFSTHRTLRRGSVNVGGAGTVDVSDIRRSLYNLGQVHFETASIGDIEILVNQRSIYEVDRVISDLDQSTAGKVPDATMTHIDFVAGGRAVDMIGMNVEDFRIRADFTAAGNFVYYVDANEGGIAVAPVAANRNQRPRGSRGGRVVLDRGRKNRFLAA